MSTPSPGDGYRWLEPDVDYLQEGDQHEGVNGWVHTFCVGERVEKLYQYRRRIEPASEPEQWVDVPTKSGWYWQSHCGVVHDHPCFIDVQKRHRSVFDGWLYRRVILPPKPAPPPRKFEPVEIKRRAAYEKLLVSAYGNEIAIDRRSNNGMCLTPSEWRELRAACDAAAEFIEGQ